jgi:cytochrome P450 family 142 subfamily A polypeptide 1
MSATDQRDIDLLDRQLYAGDADDLYAWLRANAPVYWDERRQLWGLSRYADVLAAEKDPATFSSAKGARPNTDPDPSMINHDDPRHFRQRRLVYKGFTPKRVAGLEPHVRAVVTQIIDKVAPLGRCDFVRDVATPLPMVLIAEMLGVAEDDRDALQEWSDRVIAGADGPENVTTDVLEAFDQFSRYITEVLEDRRHRPVDDLVSILVHAEIDDERLSEEELIFESLLLLVGGNETTRNVIAGGMEALIRHPEQRAKLVADPSKIPVAVEEMLRWVSPVLNMKRTATRDVELHGEKIREGDQVLLMYASANRDEDVFDAPERFDVERDPNPHLAFGFGPHFCLGASLARLNLRVMFEELLRRVPDMELAPGAELTRTPSSFMRGLVSMPVEFAPR